MIQTKTTILERLLSDYNRNNKDDTTSIEGGFAFDTLASNAVEFEKAYAELRLVMDASFPQTSWGKYLTMKAEEHGIIRRSATHATVFLTVKGSEGAVIPVNSLFTTSDNKEYRTVEEGVIGSDQSCVIKACSVGVGTDYNVTPNTIQKTPIPIYGVSSVTNNKAGFDGYTEESDQELLKRLLFKVRQPATSGNAYHYQLWATSVDGVGAVKVLPLWNGNGTVKVLVVDAQNHQANEELLKRVRAVIDANAPIGATVTVEAPKLKPINVTVKVTKGKADVDAVKKLFNDYFQSTIFVEHNISYARIGKLLLSEGTGIDDYANLTINGGVSNIAISDTEVPSLGDVVIT